MTEQEQIETQANSIKALWVLNTKLQKQCEVQQGMLNWRQARIEELEAQLTPQAQAERHFE